MKPNIYIIIIFSIIVTGCISEKKIVRRYYTIEIPAGQLPVNIDSIPVINGDCEIGQVEVNKVYEKNQIVNRAGSHEVSYYMYNQWAIRPSDAIKEMIQEYLEATRLFQSISARYSRSIPAYRFWTSINRLELIENNKSSAAHLNLEFRIIDNSNDKVILTHIADRINTLDRKDLNIFALEVSKMIFEELNIFSGMIRDNGDLFTRDH
jgi:ABC-type uncharacterized transport system auxiliary subunit